MSEENEMIDVKNIASRVVVRGLVSITTEERDELLSWEQAAYAAEEANGRCAELAAEIERLKGQDEVHWKTRRTLLAELERHQAEAAKAIREAEEWLAYYGADEPGFKEWCINNAAAIQRAREKGEVMKSGSYHGRAYNRPLNRGLCIEGDQDLTDLMDEDGYYELTITWKKIEGTDATTAAQKAVFP